MRSVLPLIFLITLLWPSTRCNPREGQSLADYLWEQTTELQEQALNSNFIQGVKRGCLDPTQFGAFMVQDSVYCYEATVTWQTAADRSLNATVREFLKSTADSWKGYWEWLYDAWHIKNTEGIRLGEAASKYISHSRAIAENPADAPEYTILAFTPCAKLWPWLGLQIGSGEKDFGVYTSWVEENLDCTSEGYKVYQDYVQWAYDAGKVTAERALEIFTASMRSEVAFFNSVEKCSGGE